MTPDLLSALGGGGGVAITFYVAMRKGLITALACKGCRDTQEANMNTLRETTDIKLASGERQFKEIKDSIILMGQTNIELTGSVNKLIGRHERVLEELEGGNGKGEGKG